MWKCVPINKRLLHVPGQVGLWHSMTLLRQRETDRESMTLSTDPTVL